MRYLRELTELPSGVLALILILSLFVLALLAYTIWQWANTPASRFNMLPKPLWLIIILITQPIGPILFLTLGREPESVQEQPSNRMVTEEDVVQQIYGSGEYK